MQFSGRIPRRRRNLAQEVFERIAHQVVGRLPVDRLAPDFKQERHGERGNARQINMPDSCPNAGQKGAEALDVEEPCSRIHPRRFKQNMARIVFSEHIVDEVRRGRHLPSASRGLDGAAQSTRQ